VKLSEDTNGKPPLSMSDIKSDTFNSCIMTQVPGCHAYNKYKH